MNTSGKTAKTGWMGVAIAGPTASGKSALALDLARRLNGTLINADSMQVYRDLRLLTARPSRDEEAQVPHLLYGYLDGAVAASAAHWAQAAKLAIEQVQQAGRVPILVGGTGLYFRSLFQGLAVVPPIPDALRSKWRALGQQMSAQALHELLQQHDPQMAARLQPQDRQRIVRALEVWEASGRSLAAWQAEPSVPLVEGDGWCKLILQPERAWLHERVVRRFATMMKDGAIDEVAQLLARGLDPSLPVMKAIGVAEIARFLAGELDALDAQEQAVLATQRYIKRQTTWLRTQMAADWQRVPWPLSDGALDSIISGDDFLCSAPLALDDRLKRD